MLRDIRADGFDPQLFSFSIMMSSCARADRQEAKRARSEERPYCSTISDPRSRACWSWARAAALESIENMDPLYTLVGAIVPVDAARDS